MEKARIAIIGGSGLYQMDGLQDVDEVDLTTPFGKPSDTITLGKLGNERVAFLPRHGRGHRIQPSDVPVRANIFALKTLGVERIISVSAVGSLRETFEPLDLVIPHQLIDRTFMRHTTFFEENVVAHIGFAHPFCPTLSQLLFHAASKTSAKVHAGATLIVMEGPAFSTKAESFMYKSWNADIIGMTALPEAKLAREAEICYTTLASVTDYDCWREQTEVVTVDMVISNLLKNTKVAKETLRNLISTIPDGRNCLCGSALKDAIVTQPAYIPQSFREKMFPITGKYLKSITNCHKT
jgi:5'-methylthioadenosine phosphorylase